MYVHAKDQLGYTWCWLADPWPLVWCIFSPVTDLYVTVRYPDWTALFSSYCNISKPDVTFFPSVFGFCCIVFGLLASRSCSAVLKFWCESLTCFQGATVKRFVVLIRTLGTYNSILLVSWLPVLVGNHRHHSVLTPDVFLVLSILLSFAAVKKKRLNES